MKLSIVIATYNRPDSLKRLLRSLNGTFVPKGYKPDLFICIDGEDNDVALSAFTFTGQLRPKCVFGQHLGLKDHLVRCLNLGLENHDACILLEDDLFVSHHFLYWTKAALDEYSENPRVASISLYSPMFNEYAGLPFIPLHNGSDSYLLQVPSSWGVCWTKKQWDEFQAFYATNRTVPEDAYLPIMVKGWPDTSLKKHIAHYLCVSGKTVIYPRVSFATNFGDAGTHCEQLTHKFQVPLCNGLGARDFQFNDALFYDSFYEPRVIVDDESIRCDLLGLKPKSSFKVISCRQHANPIKSWGLRMIPPEANVFYDIPGDDIHMGEAFGFAEPTPEDRQKLVNLYSRFTLPTPDLEHYWRERVKQCQGWADAGDREQYNQGRADAFKMCADEWGKVPKLT